MRRALFLLLILALAAAVNPDLRARVQPYVQPALDPVYEWSVRSRVAEISRSLAADLSGGRAVPDQRGFSAYLESSYPGVEAALDPWGTPYYLQKEIVGVRVVSAGRDRERGTEDDILSSLVAP
jgi:hypothetical protein